MDFVAGIPKIQASIYPHFWKVERGRILAVTDGCGIRRFEILFF
jgi:hypothetical protein